MGEREDLALLANLFKDETEVPCVFDLWSLWLVGSACQMTCTHPGIGEPLRQKYREIGKLCQGYLAELHPETDHIFEMGWYRHNDVKTQVSPLAPIRDLPSRPLSSKRRNRGRPR